MHKKIFIWILSLIILSGGFLIIFMPCLSIWTCFFWGNNCTCLDSRTLSSTELSDTRQLFIPELSGFMQQLYPSYREKLDTQSWNVFFDNGISHYYQRLYVNTACFEDTKNNWLLMKFYTNKEQKDPAYTCGWWEYRLTDSASIVSQSILQMRGYLSPRFEENYPEKSEVFWSMIQSWTLITYILLSWFELSTVWPRVYISHYGDFLLSWMSSTIPQRPLTFTILGSSWLVVYSSTLRQ